jgi:hypothetical protein
MRVIALIDDPAVVRRILEHLGCAAPKPAARGPPVQAPEWPANAVIPLTYHPVPDIDKSARGTRLVWGPVWYLDYRSGSGLCRSDRKSGCVPFMSTLMLHPRFTLQRVTAESCNGPLWVCAVTRRRFSSGCKPHPATAPAGSNRSSHGGNEVAEAFG